MAIQLPARTLEQINDIKQGIIINSLYPYTFRIQRTFTAGNFPSSDAAGSGNFVQFLWTPSISLAIVIVEGNSFQIGGAGFVSAIQISLNSQVTLGDASSLTIPTDEANIIYQGIFSASTLSVSEHRFLPSDYYIQQGTPVYVSFWIQSSALGTGGTLLSSVILHTIPLGLGV